MQKFEYCVPTKIVFGLESEKQISNLVKEYNGSNILIVYGSSPKKNGLVDYVIERLRETKINSYEVSGVVPNPRLSLVYNAIETYKNKNIDLVLGIGGGSAIDTAKAIALGLANPNDDVWDYFIKKKEPNKTIAVGCILTLSAAGSETSSATVLTNDVTKQKRGLRHELNRPKFAIMNPSLTFSLPKYQVACGACDIIFHTLDRYFTSETGNYLTDRIAESLIKTVIKYAPIAYNNPQDYDAMSELMWAGSVSHNGLTGLGGKDDFSTHQLGHELSAMFDIAHGASLTAVWPSYANYVYKEHVERFALFARNVFDIDEVDDAKCALMGINNLVDFFNVINMPTCFSECDFNILDNESIEKLAFNCTFEKTRTIGCLKVLNYDDILNIYHMCNK